MLIFTFQKSRGETHIDMRPREEFIRGTLAPGIEGGLKPGLSKGTKPLFVIEVLTPGIKG